MKQKGFTLVELLVALPIGAVLLASVVAGIFLIPRGTIDVRNSTTALVDLENATHWLNRDVPLGQMIDLVPGASPATSMNISWNDYTGGPGSSITHFSYFYVSGTRLMREYDSASNITVAGHNLSYVGFSVDANNLVTVNLTTTPAGPRQKSINRTYQIQMIGIQ